MSVRLHSSIRFFFRRRWAVCGPLLSGTTYPHAFTARFYRRLNIPAPSRGVGDNLWDRVWVNRKEVPWLTVYMKDGRIYVGRGVEFSLASEAREILLGIDTSMYDKDWNLIRQLPRGEGVWIPVSEVSSIDIHECPP